MPKARDIALKALLKVNKDLAYSNITLNNILQSEPLPQIEKSFVTALFYGVLDRKITLDYVLDKATSKPFSKVSPFTAEVLRLALYQIMYMDNVPDSAAVNEAVKQIKSSKERYNSGFVNAVLRSILRNGVQIPSDNSLYSLSIRYSCPVWIIEGFINDYGLSETLWLLEASLNQPPVTLRVNTLKTTKEELVNSFNENGIKADVVDETDAVIINGFWGGEESHLYKQGLFHAQDLSSQYTIKQFGLKCGERVLDMCAAPGGKSFTMAQYVGVNGSVVSCDIYENRVSLIKNGAERLGLNNIKTALLDATKYNEELGKFDAVLCDVPCSGLGIMRRKPDIKYKKVDELEALQQTQLDILENAVNYLSENGRIMYSTCTLRKGENEENITRFLEKHKDFKLIYQHTFMPHKDNTDGFFAALLGR